MGYEDAGDLMVDDEDWVSYLTDHSTTTLHYTFYSPLVELVQLIWTGWQRS